MIQRKDHILEVQGLAYHFEGQPLLQDVSFSLAKGEILCLLGPSGSGKTTLLRLIAGLEEATCGSIRFNNRDLQPIPPHKRNFGMMFQEYALFPHKSVLGNIALGLEMLNVPMAEQDAKVQQMLELVGLSGYDTRRIDDLSGGERQRVALARSLAPRPQLLLLDEPLGSLDRTLRDRLAIEIRSILKSLGVTAIFVTHDQTEAFSIADKVAVLHQGTLHRFDTPEKIYRNPGSKGVALFLGFTNFLSISECADGGRPDLFDGRLNCNFPPQPGPEKILLIRPEGARLLTEDSRLSCQPTLTGTVADRRFQGGTYKVKIRVGRSLLTFDLPIDPPPPAVDQPIRLQLNPSALVVIEDDGSAAAREM
ncbi:MAG: ABC transporter ATP-binding protein [Desulforhopalus sp.]